METSTGPKTFDDGGAPAAEIASVVDGLDEALGADWAGKDVQDVTGAEAAQPDQEFGPGDKAEKPAEDEPAKADDAEPEEKPKKAAKSKEDEAEAKDDEDQEKDEGEDEHPNTRAVRKRLAKREERIEAREMELAQLQRQHAEQAEEIKRQQALLAAAEKQYVEGTPGAAIRELAKARGDDLRSFVRAAAQELGGKGPQEVEKAKGEPSAETKKLLEKVEALEAKLAAQEEQEQSQASQRQVEEWQQKVAEVASDTETYPHLAKLAEAEPGSVERMAWQTAVEYYNRHQQMYGKGESPAIEDVLEYLEQQESKRATLYGASTSQETVRAGTGTGTHPETPKRNGRQVSNKAASQVSRVTNKDALAEMTMDERLREAADAIPDDELGIYQ